MSGRLTSQDLVAFTGDLIRYRHWIGGVVYTEGVKHVADAGGAHWLLDAIVLGMKSRKMKAAMRANARLQDMQFWSLEVDADDRSAILRCVPDAGELAVVTDRIGWTDFPLKTIDIWAAFDGRRWTLYLPSEH